MIALAVTWMAKAGLEEQVAEVFRRISAESRKEPACLAVPGASPRRG